MKIDTSNSIGLVRRLITSCQYGTFGEPVRPNYEIYKCCKCNESTFFIYKGRPYCYQCFCGRYIIDKLLNKMRGEK